MTTRTIALWPIAHAAIALLSLLTASIAAAAEWRFELDPAATRISFELGATLHTVRGTARLSEGHMEFDPARGVATGRIVVTAQSLSTDHEGRDAKMHDKVLESSVFPDLVFEPLSVSGEFHSTGASQMTLDGMFTIHGDTHPLSMAVILRLEGQILSAETEFDVPYVVWGMKDPSKLVVRVSKEVRVRIEGSGRLERVADMSGAEQ